MKDIMARASADHGGVGSFEFDPGSANQTRLLDVRPGLADLKTELLKRFSGATVKVEAICDSYRLDRQWTTSNVKQALRQLEEEDLITTMPPSSERRPGTMADRVFIAFPGRRVKNGCSEQH